MQPTQPSNTDSAPLHSTAQVFLGLIICAQIGYLLLANTLNLLTSVERITGVEAPGILVDHLSGGLSDSEGHWADAYSLLQRWEQLSSSQQGWRMFSPGVGDWFTFLRVEMRWDDEAPEAPPAPGALPPVVLRGPDEPADFYHYRRDGPWRIQRFEEFFMAFPIRINEDETEQQAIARWKKRIAKQVDKQWDSTNAYLNWRWTRYQRKHPETPTPRQLILLLHSYTTAAPEVAYGKYIGPTVMPVARWQVGNPSRRAGTRKAIETWDPEKRQWLSPE